jgi:hypothetical protein
MTFAAAAYVMRTVMTQPMFSRRLLQTCIQYSRRYE